MTQPVDQTSTLLVRSRPGRKARVKSHTNFGRVVSGTENQFGGTVVARANVGHIWLVFDQDLCTSKITQLENSGGRVKQEVLWLNIPVTDSPRVNVGQGSEELVDVELDFEDRHGGLHLVEIAGGAVHCLRDIFEDEIEIDFILLCTTRGQQLAGRLYVSDGGMHTRSPFE